METYSVHKVTSREELDAVIDVAWKAWHDPYLALERLLYPVYGYTAAERDESIRASKQRLWEEFGRHTKTPDRCWLFVKHVSGEIVAGVELNFFSQSPFPNGCPKLDFYWWLEGEEVKEFCQEMIAQASVPRSIWMQRPHGGVSNFVVHPAHRGRGIGTLLMRHHVEELDRRGIEGFVEASALGRPIYEKIGYQAVMKYGAFIPAGKSDDWKRWYHEMAPEQFFAMWRPKFGRIEKGERTKPWQNGPSLPID